MEDKKIEFTIEIETIESLRKQIKELELEVDRLNNIIEERNEMEGS